MITNIPTDLQAGDVLLYNSGDITDAIIRWKEGDPDTAHVEVYIGNGKSVASRNGIGVKDVYDFRPAGLVHVRRLRIADRFAPGPPGLRIENGADGQQQRDDAAFDLEAAMTWFAKVKGAPYGWGDIGVDAGLMDAPEDAWTKPEVLMKTGMDCSHFASLFLMAGSREQFDPAFDARRITPRDFKLSSESYAVWDYKALVQSRQSGSSALPYLSPRAEGEQIVHTVGVEGTQVALPPRL